MTTSHTARSTLLARTLAVAGLLGLAALACSLPGSSSGGGGGGGNDSGPTNTPGPKVLYKDDFSSSSSGWATGSDDTGSLDYTDGEYVFKITKEKWFTWGNLADEKFSNVRIEVDVQNKSDSDEPTFGIMCDYQEDKKNYYYAGFGSDGYYAIIRTKDDKDSFLTDATNDQWIQSDKISKNADKYHLTLECANGDIKLSVDGKEIASVQDDTFSSGRIGLFVLTFDKPQADVRFDNLKVFEVK